MKKCVSYNIDNPLNIHVIHSTKELQNDLEIIIKNEHPCHTLYKRITKLNS